MMATRPVETSATAADGHDDEINERTRELFDIPINQSIVKRRAGARAIRVQAMLSSTPYVVNVNVNVNVSEPRVRSCIQDMTDKTRQDNGPSFPARREPDAHNALGI
jgi:hypothetical protein